MKMHLLKKDDRSYLGTWVSYCGHEFDVLHLGPVGIRAATCRRCLKSAKRIRRANAHRATFEANDAAARLRELR